MRGIGKLRSRSGATMVLALLVFMLCIFVGTAALTAAAANSGRYTHLKEEEQAYLNVSSAAKLFRDEFVKCQYTGTVTVVEEPGKDSSVAVSGAVGLIDTSSGLDTEIPELFVDYIGSVLAKKEKPTSAITSAPSGFTVTYGDDDVKVTCATDGYNLTFTFSQGDNYKTVLKLVGTPSYSVPTVTEDKDPTGTAVIKTTTEKPVTVSWSEENAHISEPSKNENH